MSNWIFTRLFLLIRAISWIAFLKKNSNVLIFWLKNQRLITCPLLQIFLLKLFRILKWINFLSGSCLHHLSFIFLTLQFFQMHLRINSNIYIFLWFQTFFPSIRNLFFQNLYLLKFYFVLFYFLVCNILCVVW